MPDSEKLAIALRDALASGEFKRVRWVVPQGGPMLTWLNERWHEMRSGAWSPRSWEVRYETFYARSDGMAGILEIAVQTSDSRHLTRSFPIQALRRAGVWVFSDSIPLGRPDAVVSSQELNVDLRSPGYLRAESLMRLKASGPDRRIFFELAPELKVTRATWGRETLPFRQIGDLVYVGAPVRELDAAIRLVWEGEIPTAGAVRKPGLVTVLPPTSAWWPRQPVPARSFATKAAVMVPAGWVSLMPGDPPDVERFPDGWLYRHRSESPLSNLSLWMSDWPHREQRTGVTPVTGYAQSVNAGALAAAAAEVQSASGYLADRLSLPTPRHWLIGECGALVSQVQGNLLLLSSETLASDIMRRTFVPSAMAATLLEQLTLSGTEGEQLLLREGLSGYLAAQLLAQTEGSMAFRDRLWESIRRFDAIVGTSGDIPLSKVDAEMSSDLRRVLLQDKGVMVFHMLRNRLGGDVFARALRNWAARPERSWVSFVAACEAESQKNLSAFIAQWLGRTGRPEVSLADVQIMEAGDGFAVTGRLIQQGEPFSIRLPLILNTQGQSRIYHLDLSVGEVEFKLLSPHRPVRLRVDPAHDFLLKGPGPVELGP
ncbi:MAG: hypothetical protein VKN33_06595 [Candidatus Sericytochromatia bacterium]|nr:hypothetical protein [Candidatus Sericytochromatia bacterium]